MLNLPLLCCKRKFYERSTLILILRKGLLGICFTFALLKPLSGDAPAWDFNLPHLGRVLNEGGWFQKYSLGVINASPEFNFPLQLVYLSTREAAGMFGPQWFCPQLESTVIPQGDDAFYWQTMAGNIVLFRRSDSNDSSIYSDKSGKWIAKASTDRQEIRNQEGWKFTYDRGRLKSRASPTGRLLAFVWNGNDLQGIRIVDPVSWQERTLLQITYLDDPHGVTDLIFNGSDQQFTYHDEHDGLLDSWTLPTKQHIYFDYAEQGILTEIQPQGEPPLKFTSTIRDTDLISSDQDDQANWWLIKDPDYEYTYASNGRKGELLLSNKVTAVSTKGLTVTSDFNPQGGTLTVNDGTGNTCVSSYYRAPGKSFDGKIKSIEQNGLVKTEYTYDPTTGLLSSVTDKNGLTTYFDYPKDWKKDWKNPWDPKPIRVWRGTEDHPKVLSQYWYDDLGRVVATQDAAGLVTNVGYTARGELGSITTPDGLSTSLAYDSFGHCVQATKGDQTEAVEYDDEGRIKTRTTPDGTKTEFVYDKLGNLSQVFRNGKIVMSYFRDADGNIIGQKDSLGRTAKMDFDSHGNVLAEYGPDGSVTKYEYDRYNRRTSQIDGNGNKYSFAYDAGDHITSQTNAIGNTISWVYDNQGHLAEEDNGVQQIKYVYDDNDHVTSIDYGTPDQTINSTYDDQGRVTSLVTPVTAFYYIYDKLGRKDAIRAICGSEEQLLRFFYNYSGQRTAVILAKGIPAVAPADGKIGYDAHYEVLQQTEYSYDESHHLTAIVSNGRPVVTYRYDDAGRPVLKTFGNGMKAILSYDSEGHPARVIFSGGPLEVPLTLAYVWDVANEVVQRAWNGSIQDYEYDPSGKLIKVTDDKTKQVLEAYAYDRAGNIIEKNLGGQKTLQTYNAANELISRTGPSGSVQYTYDAAGRVVGYGNGTANTYGWSDKLTSVLAGSNGARIDFTYWPDGQLAVEDPILIKPIFKPASATSSPQNALSMQGEQTTMEKPTLMNLAMNMVPGDAQPDSQQFLWDGMALIRRNDVVYIIEPHANGGNPIASHPINRPNEITYYLNDFLGTTLAVAKNQAVNFYNLSSFGEITQQASVPDPSAITPPTVATPQLLIPQQPPQNSN
jgi:YD repeat-containing protein